MSSFSAKNFFSFEQASHNFWQDDEPVWMVLHRLEEIFQNWHTFEKKCFIPSYVHLDDPETIAIGEGTILEPGVFIQGPCILGKGCIIRHGAYLRGGVICGDHCVVGHCSEIKRSILLDGVQIAHLDYVGDSIIGNRVNLGAGVKCANLRLDRREVNIFFEDCKIPTGLKKFGCVIGDGCQIGCNAVLNPGTLVGRDSASYPLLNLQGVIPSRTRIKGQGTALEFSVLESAVLESLRQLHAGSS